MFFHVLLPEHTNVTSVASANKKVEFKQTAIEQSNYADFETGADGIKTFDIHYD